MIKSYYFKVRILVTVVVLFCICSQSNNHKGVWHQHPITPQKPEAQMSKQPNKTFPGEVLHFLQQTLTYIYCFFFLDTFVQNISVTINTNQK